MKLKWMRKMQKTILVNIFLILILSTSVLAEDVNSVSDAFNSQNFLTKTVFILQNLNFFVVTPSISGKYIDVRTPREPTIDGGAPILVNTNDKVFKCNYDACVIYFYDAKTTELYNCPKCQTDFLSKGGIGLSRGIYVGKKLVRGQELNSLYIPKAPYRYAFFGDNELPTVPKTGFVKKFLSSPVAPSTGVQQPASGFLEQKVEKFLTGKSGSTGDAVVSSGFGSSVTIQCGEGTVLDLTTNSCVVFDDLGAKQRACEEEGSVYSSLKGGCVGCKDNEVIENHACVSKDCPVGSRLINRQCVEDNVPVWLQIIPFFALVLLVFVLGVYLIWR